MSNNGNILSERFKCEFIAVGKPDDGDDGAADVCFVQQSPELIDPNLYDQVALNSDWIARTSTLKS